MRHLRITTVTVAGFNEGSQQVNDDDAKNGEFAALHTSYASS
jgi:hypothetical protein